MGAHRAEGGARHLAFLVFALLLLYVALAWDQHGISNDEEVQHRYGELILDYYTSGLTDRSVFTYKNLYLYGGLETYSTERHPVGARVIRQTRALTRLMTARDPVARFLRDRLWALVIGRSASIQRALVRRIMGLA